MKLISWNIRGGRRHSEVVDAVMALGPDVAVLVDCKAMHVEPIAAKAADAGYTYHLESFTDYTGILMLSSHPLTSAGTDQAPIEHRWLHAVSDHWGLEIAAVYGPLPKTIRAEPKMSEFWNWLVPACDRMVDRRVILCGDFNTGISGIDGPADFSYACVSQFRDLETHGWKDAYRELHPGGRSYSWWHNGRGFRVDHCMLSRGLTAPYSVAYIDKIAGIRLGSPLIAPTNGSGISDHSALALDLQVAHRDVAVGNRP
jgi:exodeoxyribonuclease III